MISFTPPQYILSLRTVSVVSLTSSEEVKGFNESLRERANPLTMNLSRHKHSELSDAVIEQLGGLAGAPWSDRQIAEAIYDVHGPYPVDGYRLYFLKTKVAPVTAVAKYFKSDQVSLFVGKYCPAKSA